MKIFELKEQHTKIFNQLWMLDEDDADDKLEFDRLTAELESLTDSAESTALFLIKLSRQYEYDAANKKDAAARIMKRAKTAENNAAKFKGMALALMQRFDVPMVEDSEVRLKRYYPAASCVIDDSVKVMDLPDGCIIATMKTTDKATIKRAFKNENVVIEVAPIKSELKKLLPVDATWSQGVGFQTADILPGVYAVKTETLRVS